MTPQPLPGELPASHYGIHLHPQILIQDRLPVSLAPSLGLPSPEPLSRALDHVLAVTVNTIGRF